MTKLPNYAITDRLPIGGFASNLGLQVAGFATGTAIVDTVFAQAGVIQALAQRAVFVAGAASFRLFTDQALEFFGHRREIIAISGFRQWPMVDGPVVEF
jgi:hypothetical protein